MRSNRHLRQTLLVRIQIIIIHQCVTFIIIRYTSKYHVYNMLLYVYMVLWCNNFWQLLRPPVKVVGSHMYTAYIIISLVNDQLDEEHH